MKTKLNFSRLSFIILIMLSFTLNSCSTELLNTETITDKKLMANASATIGNQGAVISSFKIANGESFYSIYHEYPQWGVCPVKSSNTKRYAGGSYIRLVSDSEKDLIGNNIDFRIELYAGYDIWDHNAYSWYIKVPKGTTNLQNINPNIIPKSLLSITPLLTLNTIPTQTA
ncbi:TPA: hypothetical protein ACWX1I_003673 [Elizabethkingia anophelis]